MKATPLAILRGDPDYQHSTGRVYLPEPPSIELPEEPLRRYNIGLPSAYAAALREIWTADPISEVVREYLNLAKGPLSHVPMDYVLPCENDGIVTIIWQVPKDLDRRLFWRSHVDAHISRAIKTYFERRGIRPKAPKRAYPRREYEVVEFGLKPAEAAALSSLEGSANEHLTEAVKLQYAYDKGNKGDCWVDADKPGEGLHWLRWKAPTAIANLLPSGTRERAEFIRAGVYRYCKQKGCKL